MITTKTLVTRYGGAGDLIMLEPVLEALYYKYRPAEVYLRTHPHYQDLHIFHPLLVKTIPGILVQSDPTSALRSDEKKPQGFDLFYNTTGSVEMNRGIHGIDSFAFACSATPIRRTPVLYLDPDVDVVPRDIVIHTPKRSATSPRNMDFCNHDIPAVVGDYLTKKNVNFDSITAIGSGEEQENGLQGFAQTIAGAHTFIGPDSAGVHIAAALSVPRIVAAYTDDFPAGTRSYPNVLNTPDNDLGRLLRLVERAYTAPERLFTDNVTHGINMSQKYAYGPTMDYEGVVHGGPFSLIRTFPGFLSNSDWRQEIWALTEQLEHGGTLFLYDEHPKYANSCDPLLLVKFLMGNVRMQVVNYSATPDRFGNFYVAAQKAK